MRAGMKKLLLLFPFAILSGCVAFHARPVSPSQSASAFEQRTLDSLKLEKYIETNLHKKITLWPPKTWDFNMLEMAAAYYNPALDVARAKWGVASAAVITAGEIPNPGVSVLGQHHSSIPGGISPWTWGLSLDIPVQTAGKRGYRIRRAQQLSEAARLNITEAEWQIRSGLRKSLLDLYAAANRGNYLQSQLESQQKIVNMFEARLTSGESSQFEVTQSRLALDKIRLLLANNAGQKARARSELAVALGLPAKALNGINISFNIFRQLPQPINLKSIKQKALTGRADMLAALQQYAAAQSELQLQIARQYPDIHIGPGYEWDQGDNKWTLGLSISLPIFNRNQGPIAEAKARRKESAASFLALQAGVTGQIDREEAAYALSLDTLKTAGNIVSGEQTGMRAAKDRFASGDTSSLELEQVKMELARAQLAQFEAVISAQAELGKLEDAVQQPLDNGWKNEIK